MDPVITKAAADAAVAVSKEAYEDIVHPAATNIGKTGGSGTRLLHAIFGRGCDAISLKFELYWDRVEQNIRRQCAKS
jgi:hypothetical protein